MIKEWSLQEQIYLNFLNLFYNKEDFIDILSVVDPSDLKYLKEPNEEIQMKAVKKNGMALQFIKKPSELVQLEAIKKTGHAIQCIKNPSEKIQLESIFQIRDEDLYMQFCFNKIKSSIALNVLYQKLSDKIYKNKIKKSKYWKDNANLIMEVIHEASSNQEK